eukprot:GHVU01112863.1.p1 GENE.GHVU01112863.1~~GHVU01112863.1.p1  ORF type:complete len:454 (-),score=40.63 GHVU01112863.1:67-1428(-)
MMMGTCAEPRVLLQKAVPSWEVWKFGGTSVATSAEMLRVRNILLQETTGAAAGNTRYGIVISAMKGVTDDLSNLCDMCSSSSISTRQHLFSAAPSSAPISSSATHSVQAARACNERHADLPAAGNACNRLQTAAPNGVPTGRPDGKLHASGSVEEVERIIQGLTNRHVTAAKELATLHAISVDQLNKFQQELEKDMNTLRNLLSAVYYIGQCSTMHRDATVGFGELWSSKLVYAILAHMRRTTATTDCAEADGNACTGAGVPGQQQDPGSREENGGGYPQVHHEQCESDMGVRTTVVPSAASSNSGERVAWLDARQVLVVASKPASAAPSGQKDCCGPPQLDYETSQRLLDKWLSQNEDVSLVVVPGFICSTTCGRYTTFKRNGSDYSASLLGALLGAETVTLWSDVDGVYTADPRLVPTAFSLPSISPAEALELSHFGAKVGGREDSQILNG